jgi:glycosyltransferase involved in cell wall biosynthesis
MRVSVVLCTHSLDRYDDLLEAAESVRSQTCENVELVLVSDGNDEVSERFEWDFGTDEDTVITALPENRGLLEARNHGAETASGDVVAFLDDDAIAEPGWVAELVEAYEQRDAIAAGGKMTGRWVAGRPSFLPEEFYWLVGVTHRGFPTEECEVRNTFGSNISFRREVFEELGGFETNLGRSGEKNLQGEETEFAARMRQRYGEGVWYDPEAVVEHKVFDYRTKPKWLLERAFWQGYSKRVMSEVLPDEDGGQEGAFLKRLLMGYLPGRAKRLVVERELTQLLQIAAIVAFTGAVGLGYLTAAVCRHCRIASDESFSLGSP